MAKQTKKKSKLSGKSGEAGKKKPVKMKKAAPRHPREIAKEKASAKKKVVAIKKSFIVKNKLIESFEEACKVTGRNAQHLPIVDHLPLRDRSFNTSIYKLMVISEAQNLNDGFVPDYSNSNQWKYWPYFWVKKDKSHPSGFGFGATGYVYSYTGTAVGARLCVNSSSRAIEIGNQHAELFKDVAFPPVEKKKTSAKKSTKAKTAVGRKK